MVWTRELGTGQQIFDIAAAGSSKRVSIEAARSGATVKGSR
jgi:hypothetical protein